MASSKDFPTPKYITGGCLCEALRYRVDFPENHDFQKNSMTCQCTQDRRNTGSFFFPAHRAPRSGFQWTSPSTSTLGQYSASPGAERGFCKKCGSFLYWRRVEAPEDVDDDKNATHTTTNTTTTISIAVGTVDPLFLFGEDADGTEVPEGGFGRALANAGGGHEWCKNEIPGVTDMESMKYFGEGGRRWAKGEDEE
ncbi:hypothetical protein F4777DRAFT_484316 [Nemania sp. FL0916]|nr:hypothetical protein F4777DRAFT_484316 [Nemania sp. FL0916]